MHATWHTSHQSTWKNHFLAIRTGVPKIYRLSNWCKDLEQTDITLNMLRPCTQNPKLSAYEAMEGMFSFDAIPMAPIGIECMIHIKPSRQHTWGYHVMKAWNCTWALKYYRCIKVVTETGTIRINCVAMHSPLGSSCVSCNFMSCYK